MCKTSKTPSTPIAYELVCTDCDHYYAVEPVTESLRTLCPRCGGKPLSAYFKVYDKKGFGRDA